MPDAVTDSRYVVQLDMPSIKQYVFGTDPLNEVRGASAILDQLNRWEMDRLLRKRIDQLAPAAAIERVYANGGSGQFLISGCDWTNLDIACRHLVHQIRRETGGEVRVVYGIAPINSSISYRRALRQAYFMLRCQRDSGSACLVSTTMPLVMECTSASHLPAAHRTDTPDGIRMLSATSSQKVGRGRQARNRGVWAEWMRYLESKMPWPGPEDWNSLRCASLVDIGRRSDGKIGVVYADGNAMGRLIRAIDSPRVSSDFSRIVDESIREACFVGLRRVCGEETSQISDALGDGTRLESLPCDILLLGGDDLLVAVPANRALSFALEVTVEFERRTAKKIDELTDSQSRRFFTQRLVAGGLSISCGVAIVKGTYPFYLSLGLAEQLLKNAKRNPGHWSTQGSETARVDFHVVASSASQEIQQVREQEYHVSVGHSPRTMRPLTCPQLEALRDSVRGLRATGFPRSKLKALHDAALMQREDQAAYHIRDIFSRARHGGAQSERRALWNAVSRLCPEGYRFDFPWFTDGRRRMLCVADIVDAYGLFESRAEVAS